MSELNQYRVLITITSCNRIQEVKKYILDYVNFCNNNEKFSFLLSLDGTDADYQKFCDQFEIPLLYSDQREGVGLSKNRVLKMFPNFEHYFFIDDDIELYNSKIFKEHVKFGNLSSQFHHLSSTEIRMKLDESIHEGQKIVYSTIGGGYFNYFTKNGLDKVGGWHTDFAKYKRYGHTEHSHRFKNAGITDFPFTVIEDCINDLILHNPGHVTASIGPENEQTELFIEEQHLMDQKLTYFPVITLSDFHFNGHDLNFNSAVAAFLSSNKKKYPLISGINRLKCFSSFYFFLSKTKPTWFSKIWYFCLASVCHPLNPEIKHAIKTKLIR